LRIFQRKTEGLIIYVMFHSGILRVAEGVVKMESGFGITASLIGLAASGLGEEAGGVEEAEILKSQRDIDGGVGAGEIFIEPLFKIEQRRGEFDFVAIEKCETIMQSQRIGLEAGRRRELFEGKGFFVGFAETDGELVAGGRKDGV
jgi:hypothetical protein